MPLAIRWLQPPCRSYGRLLRRCLTLPGPARCHNVLLGGGAAPFRRRIGDELQDGSQTLAGAHTIRLRPDAPDPWPPGRRRQSGRLARCSPGNQPCTGDARPGGTGGYVAGTHTLATTPDACLSLWLDPARGRGAAPARGWQE